MGVVYAKLNTTDSRDVAFRWILEVSLQTQIYGCPRFSKDKEFMKISFFFIFLFLGLGHRSHLKIVTGIRLLIKDGNLISFFFCGGWGFIWFCNKSFVFFQKKSLQEARKKKWHNPVFDHAETQDIFCRWVNILIYRLGLPPWYQAEPAFV